MASNTAPRMVGATPKNIPTPTPSFQVAPLAGSTIIPTDRHNMRKPQIKDSEPQPIKGTFTSFSRAPDHIHGLSAPT
jgi:hypothetical protein